MNDRLINQTEAARLLGVDRTTLWRWVQLKRIKPSAFVNGSTPLFDRDYIELFAESRKRQAVGA